MQGECNTSSIACIERGCRELPENARNREREEAAASYLEVPENFRNEKGKGGMRGCRELPEMAEIGRGKRLP